MLKLTFAIVFFIALITLVKLLLDSDLDGIVLGTAFGVLWREIGNVVTGFFGSKED